MSKTINERVTVDIEGDFVVFLIGMRINRFWKFGKWVPMVFAMPRMLKELSMQPESGLLGFQMLGGIPPVIIQYWRSFEHLEAYARDQSAHHFPAWRRFNKNMKNNGDAGIWHETYKVRAGEYECVYNNMPPYGLGKAGRRVSATGRRQSAAGRMTKSEP